MGCWITGKGLLSASVITYPSQDPWKRWDGAGGFSHRSTSSRPSWALGTFASTLGGLLMQPSFLPSWRHCVLQAPNLSPFHLEEPHRSPGCTLLPATLSTELPISPPPPQPRKRHSSSPWDRTNPYVDGQDCQGAKRVLSPWNTTGLSPWNIPCELQDILRKGVGQVQELQVQGKPSIP